MFVAKRMTKEVVSVKPDDTLKHANHLLKINAIQHLPVVSGVNLVGILSGTDIRNSTLEVSSVGESGEMVIKNRTVEEIMVRDVITVSPWDTVEDALLIFHEKRFGALPVVEGKKLVGIITKVDILAAFIDTLSIEELGVRIEVILTKDRNELQRLIKKISEIDLEIKSLILSPFREGYVVFIRLSTIDVATVKKELREAGFTVPELSDFLD
jgi:acetoin utilization protein AcuB